MDSSLSGAPTPWFEDDAFWRATGPVLFDGDRWDAAPGEALLSLALLGITPPGPVLDLACGTGRHALALAQLGYEVTAVDRTSTYLEEGRERALLAGCHIRWIQGDLRTLQTALGAPPARFQGALLLFNSFGYFADAEEDVRLLEGVANALEPGARLVIETDALEILVEAFRDASDDGGADVEIVGPPEDRWTLARSLDAETGVLETLWSPVSRPTSVSRPTPSAEAVTSFPGTVFKETRRIYSRHDLIAHCLRAGFSQVEAYGDLARTPFDESANQLVLVAER